MKFKIFLLLLVTIALLACNHSTESENAPEDHTVSKDGVRHKTGLNNPELNCVSCHGEILDGGTSGVSCYDCHGKKWQ